MLGDPLEDYLRELSDIRRSGSAVPETSYYPALAALLDAVGGAAVDYDDLVGQMIAIEQGV
jgi:hypothetical protein